MPRSEDSPRVVVRSCAPSEVTAVHALIVELARYERAENEVALTAEALQTDMAEGRFVCFVAEASGHIVGMALHHARYSTWKGLTWYLEDLVVTEAWRGQGVGRALFLAVAAHARSVNAKRLEWQVLDWNEPAIGSTKPSGRP